jgi:hypothetical protein
MFHQSPSSPATSSPPEATPRAVPLRPLTHLLLVSHPLPMSTWEQSERASERTGSDCICFAAACAIFVGKVRWWLCWPYQHPILRCQRQLLESQPQGLPRRMLQKNAFPAACCRDSNSSRQEFLDVNRRRYCRDRVLSHCCACWQNTRYNTCI